MSEYKVALDVYNGPLDLLLFLIRRDEIDIHDIPIARITEQYLKYVELLSQLDPDIASEFLVLAATLMEIKSRTLLPSPPMEPDDEESLDPRVELVRQLLEYKKFKDAAYCLDDAAEERAKRHARTPVAPPRPEDEVELEHLAVWDLFDAFNRLLEQTGQREAVHQVGVDDTPLALHAEDITDSLERAGGRQEFVDVFAGRSRAEMIGLFLALLELIREKRVRVSQDRPFGTIIIQLLDPEHDDERAVDALESATAIDAEEAPTQTKPDRHATDSTSIKSAKNDAADENDKSVASPGWSDGPLDR